MPFPLADRIDPKRVFIPCLLLFAAGPTILATVPTRGGLIASAVVYGLGFGAAYPAYVAYILRHVDEARRGAAFGSIVAAFDTGIGTGSIAMGWVIGRFGYPAAFSLAAALAALSLPYFLVADRRVWSRT